MQGDIAGLAVIIPAHNAASTIERTLASVFAQSLPPDEIIIIDDGSTDSTRNIISAFSQRDDRVRILHQSQQGPSAARNRAIAETRRAIIAPLDADDLWDADYLKVLVPSLLAVPEAGFAYCHHRLIDGADQVLRGAMPFTIEGHCFGAMLLTNPVGNGSSAIFTRTAILEVGGYVAPDPAWWGAEDYLLQLRVTARRPVVCVPRTLSSYRVTQGTLSGNLKAARTSRLAAVDLALQEYGPCPLPLQRWVVADAARVFAVQSLMQKHWRPAVGAALCALWHDPAGTASDLVRRLVNLSRRSHGKLPTPQIDPLIEIRTKKLIKVFGKPLPATLAQMNPDAAAGAGAVTSHPDIPLSGQSPGGQNIASGLSENGKH